jgi:hypothetical protein
MIYATCLALVLMAALAETSAMRQWQQQHALLSMQQAAVGVEFPSLYRRPN